MFFSRPAGVKCIDRGDVVAPDYTKDTLDDGWNDMNLSSIIPKGTKLVILSCKLKTSLGLGSIYVKTRGFAGGYNEGGITCQTEVSFMFGNLCISPDSDRFISLYKSPGVTWTMLNVTVVKWLV